MSLKKQVANYFVEMLGLAIFLLAAYRIVVAVYSGPLPEAMYYLAIAVIALFLMNYKNLGYHIRKAVKIKDKEE